MSQPTKMLYAKNGQKRGSLVHLSNDGKTALCKDEPKRSRQGWKFVEATGYQPYFYGVCIQCFRIWSGENVDHMPNV